METSADTLPTLIPTQKVNRLKQMMGDENYKKLKKLITNPLAVTGFILLTLFALIALAAPELAPPQDPQNPYTIPRDGFRADPRPPMSEWNVRPPEYVPAWYTAVTGQTEWVHLMGTVSGQYDIWYGVVWGVRTAFLVGIIVTLAGLVMGVVIGAVAAFYGGWVDMLLMRITDVFLAFPFLVAAMTLSAVFASRGRTIWTPLIAIIIFGWMGYAQLIRGDILAVREREFVTASRVIGVNDFFILMRHILPNAIFPTIVVASLQVGGVVITFAALSFLGVGVEPGYADWGQLISFARNWVTQLHLYWYVVMFPGMAIVLFVMGWNLIGDSIRDVFDPRLGGTR
jgi:peptide/nickel transport system permease protein